MQTIRYVTYSTPYAFSHASQALNYKSKKDRTKDIYTIFKLEKYKHPETGKILNGHWCKVCK